MSICSPGSSCIVSLKGTEPDPGLVTMTSTGTNHGCGLVVRQRQSRARRSVGLMASSGSGLLCTGADWAWLCEAHGMKRKALEGAHDRGGLVEV